MRNQHFTRAKGGGAQKFPIPGWCEVKVLSKYPTRTAQVGMMGLSPRQKTQGVERKLLTTTPKCHKTIVINTN